MKMIVSEEALDLLADVGFDPAYGARPLKRTIQKQLENNIAIGILSGDFADGDTIMVGVLDGQIHIRKAYDWEAVVDENESVDVDASMMSGFN
jgi:ATP-dependent Clp protease ATP-binding subunit ClpB